MVHSLVASRSKRSRKSYRYQDNLLSVEKEMGFLAVSAVFFLCVVSSLATYGPDHKSHGSGSHFANINGKGEEPRIHLDSPKIILNRPSFNVQGGAHGPILEDESIYYGKSLHGVHSAPAVASAPYYVDSGYSTGKVLDISAPIQVINHAPIVQERPILIRRPVVVSKGLTSTQDHLERLHYAHSASYGGHGHGDYAAIPVSKGALHERTIVYGGGLGHGLGHGYGHGLVLGGHGAVSGYSSPIFVEQPKAYVGYSDNGYSSGKALGGVVLHGGALHGGAYHGGALHGGSLHGGAFHGGSYSGGGQHGGSFHGAGSKKY